MGERFLPNSGAPRRGSAPPRSQAPGDAGRRCPRPSGMRLRQGQSATRSLLAAPWRRVARRRGHLPESQGMRASRSLNNLVRPPQQGVRDDQPKRLGGFQVDDQFEGGCLFDGKVAGLGALEDSVDIVRGPSEHFRKARPIGHETTIDYKGSLLACRREPTLRREVEDCLSVSSEKWGRDLDKCLSTLLFGSFKRSYQVLCHSHVEDLKV